VYSSTFTRGSIGDGLGREVEPGTFADITDGPLVGKGANHFFSEAEIRDVFAAFAPLNIELYTHTLGGQKQTVRRWVLDGTKPK
jgi:hypothetical protein